jgi:transposase
MPCYVGLDASKAMTQVCVLDQEGSVVKAAAVPTEPKAIVAFLRGDGRRYRRIGVEAGSLGAWLYEALAKLGLPVICIETVHASTILKGRKRNKTDKNDARGIAEMMRVGPYRAVHVKTEEGKRLRNLLTARKFLRSKLVDTEHNIRSVLLGRGLKMASGYSETFERRARGVMGRADDPDNLIEGMLKVRTVLHGEAKRLEEHILRFVVGDPVCQRLMTAPSVGPYTALAYRVAIDEPRRFGRSRDIGPHLGLTPATRQSAKRDRRGRITCCGDSAARSALFLSALNQLRPSARPSWLNKWGAQIGDHRGRGKANIAVARRLAVVMHKMWVTETDFCWEAPPEQ